MTDVVGKLWGFCHTLRHDGIDYGDYIEQITYLLFLKMADERDVKLPADCTWPKLRDKSGTGLIDHYIDALRKLGKEKGILGDIYSGAQSRFTNPVSLKKLINLIDEVEWTSLGVDVKAAAYEGLLEKAASEGKIGDSIYEPPGGRRFDVILTNPPFGTKGANQAPEREDFTVSTSNKQLNFVQHVMTVLKDGGRAAVVLPDNCLFADQAGEVMKVLTEDCDVHTVLRLPRGTFTPYSQGVKANVVFFSKDTPTERIWIYDARTNVPGITKKDRPLTPEHFAEFEKCFGKDPNGKAKRDAAQSKDDRWRSFTIGEAKERDFKLDGFKWLKEESPEDANDVGEPEDLAAEAIEELKAATTGLNKVLELLGNDSEKTPGAARK